MCNNDILFYSHFFIVLVEDILLMLHGVLACNRNTVSATFLNWQSVSFFIAEFRPIW